MMADTGALRRDQNIAGANQRISARSKYNLTGSILIIAVDILSLRGL